MADKAFLIDTTRCCGCRSCHAACKQWNELPAEESTFFAGPEFTTPFTLSAITWNRINFSEVSEREKGTPLWNMLHLKCFHCRNANCMKVCPVGAISKKDGWNVINQEKCIACGLCTEFCVYNVPHISRRDYKNKPGRTVLLRERAYKCNGCTGTGREVPACVSNCPTGALTFGHRQHILKEAFSRQKILKKDHPHASVYGIKEFGGLRSIYLLRFSPDACGLPVGISTEPLAERKCEEYRNLYSLFALFSFGSVRLKRKAAKLAFRIENIERYL
jgi:formate dehydrogenase iron-sulfur subunit